MLVILEEAVLTVQRGITAQGISHLFAQLRMCQPQILIGQLLEKIDATHTVGEHMKYFEIDAVFIIGYAEHIAVVLILPDIAARKRTFLPHTRCRLAVFLKIIPEHALAQPQIKPIKLRQHHIQCLLQQFTVHQLRERHADAVYIAHALPGYHRKQMRRIVQTVPADLPLCLSCTAFFPFYLDSFLLLFGRCYLILFLHILNALFLYRFCCNSVLPVVPILSYFLLFVHDTHARHSF